MTKKKREIDFMDILHLVEWYLSCIKKCWEKDETKDTQRHNSLSRGVNRGFFYA